MGVTVFEIFDLDFVNVHVYRMNQPYLEAFIVSRLCIIFCTWGRGGVSTPMILNIINQVFSACVNKFSITIINIKFRNDNLTI